MSKSLNPPLLRAILLLLWACATLPAQRIWRVHCGGAPGTDFTDVPPAVAAAAPGDIIWVISDSTRPCNQGVYYTAPRIDRGITLIGINTYGVPGSGFGGGVLLQGLLEIRGVPLGQKVVVNNFGIVSHGAAYWPLPPHGIHVHDCAGSVLLEKLYYNGGGFHSSVTRVERCADVCFRGADLTLSGDPLTFTDSVGSLTSSLVRWRGPTVLSQYRYTNTSYSLWLTNSRVDVIASYIRGPNFASSPSYLDWPAAVVWSGELEVGPFTRLEGGSWNGSPIYSLGVISPGTARADTRATLVPGYGGWPVVQWGQFDATYHDHLIGGETYHVSVAGPPGGFGLMAVGSSAMVPTPLPGFGLLALDPASVQVIGLLALDPTDGWAEWTRSVPANVPNDHVFAFQCATLAPNGQLGLAKPSPFTVAWPNGVIP